MKSAQTSPITLERHPNTAATGVGATAGQRNTANLFTTGVPPHVPLPLQVSSTVPGSPSSHSVPAGSKQLRVASVHVLLQTPWHGSPLLTHWPPASQASVP